MNLHFSLGYEGYFELNWVACCSGDFTNDDVGGSVDELFPFDKFKYACGAFDFTKPTDIVPIFGLKGNVSGYLCSEGNLYDPIAVDRFGIDIRVPVFDSATRDTRIVGSVRRGNFIAQCLGAISPSDRQYELTEFEGSRDSRSFACDLGSARAYHDITGCVVEGNRNSRIRGNLTTGRDCIYEANSDRFICDCVIIAAAASEH